MSRAGVLGLLIAGVMLAAPGAATAQREPLPEPNFAADLLPRPCSYEGGDRYEAKFYELEGWPGPEHERYPGNCQRLRFAYGPIPVKPGQNDVLVGPITTEKPMRDGWITRFKPNLVRADGSVPPVEQVHLHHGTWLAQPDYGMGPFFAAGEEKTIAPFPKGYGMPVKATDTWELLYMVHSAVSQPMETYIVYDIDFVPKEKGRRLGLKDAFPIWLDVRPSGYPVFNTQRGFGGRDGKCTWPKERCAAFDPFGKKIVGQGKPGNGKGTDLRLPAYGKPLGRVRKFTGGTLIGIGGHLHPGGLQNEVNLVRPGRTERVKVRRKRARCRGSRARKRRCKQRRAGARRRAVKRCKAKPRKKARRRCLRRLRRKRYRMVTRKRESVRIYTGEPVYWDHKRPSRGGGPPTSWDFSMAVNGLPYWGVRVKPGDILRSNATYETELASSYENMGISVALVAPHSEREKPTARGVDPFEVKADRRLGCPSKGIAARKRRLCQKGVVTHGHLPENGNHSGARGKWNARRGARTSDVGIANFLYEPGDLTTISMTGVPTVRLGTNLRFTNADGHSIYHTVTSCKFPCLGQTSASFPLADGRTSLGRALDFDSSELGVGAPYIGPAKQELTWTLPVTKKAGYKPGEVVTYFCRIHPSMRGAFKVTK